MLVRTIPAGDLAIEGRHFVIARGVRYVRQKLSVRFKFFLGEWFLDQREGVPYYRDVFTWNPNLPVIRSLFRRLALSTPGVLAVPRFEINFTPSTRLLRFDFQAVCADGDIVVALIRLERFRAQVVSAVDEAQARSLAAFDEALQKGRSLAESIRIALNEGPTDVVAKLAAKHILAEQTRAQVVASVARQIRFRPPSPLKPVIEHSRRSWIFKAEHRR